MTTLLVLSGVGLVTWLLRVLFITVVPAGLLPAPVRQGLNHVGPAVLAAVVATSLARDQGPAGLVVPSPALLALVFTGLVTWRTGQLIVGMVAGVAAFTLLGVVWPA